jgi:type IX secretion system PorP/SprF family membrane protein
VIGRSQDIHFSHVNRQPLYQNPGNTGLFNGDIRFTANYKDQWRSVTIPFSTIAIAGDTKWSSKKINIGGLFFYDKVGDGAFQTIELIGSVAKNMLLTSDSVHTLSVGINAGLNFRQMDMSKYYYDSQWDGLFFDPSLPSNEVYTTASKANINTALGAVYQWNKSKLEQLTVGLSGHNLNRPNQGFYGTYVQRDIRVSAFGNYQRKLNQEWAILPGFSFNVQGKYHELILGSQARYILAEKLGVYRAVDAGLWFRNRDAVIIRFGVAVQNWSIAVSYDTNISKLIPASHLRGGLELSAHYILMRFKPKNVKHRICPDFI